MDDALLLASKQLSHQAFLGEWEAVFRLLEQFPALINHTSPEKGYSALHQAAWHGATLETIGGLLRLGANTQLKTRDTQQTPYDIALQKQKQRPDLHFALDPTPRTLAQLMRKIFARGLPENMAYPDLLLMDNLVMLLSDEECVAPGSPAKARFNAAFLALTGTDIAAPYTSPASIPPHWWVNTDYWRNIFLPELLELEQQKSCIPLERNWATIGDLLVQEHERWGLRGDPWLWMELRKSTTRIPLPATTKELTALLRNLVLARTNSTMLDSDAVYITRFSRGGMSSGHISLRFWEQEGIPAIVGRAGWLREMWGMV
ncbi:hypothetical protein KXR87_04315 [Yokenella regensburgei]|uniref:hypothetical protein n=1 Tax=Yokenella regensburgei TaxID=158877 RepID=UPI003F185853